MQSIKNARSRSKDPKQEAIRAEKDSWNKDVSKLIDDMIHFKKMLNGYPSKFFQQRSKITNPIPIEPSQVLSMIAAEFSSISERANSISSHQEQYSSSRVKKASSKLSRFFSYLKGPYFGSSPEALKRRDRVSLLKYSSDIYYDFKDFNSEILKRDTNSIHSAKAIFNKLSNDIYVFGTFYKAVQPPEQLDVGKPVKIEFKKEDDTVQNEKQEQAVENPPEEKRERLSDKEIDDLYSMYSKDQQLIPVLYEIVPKIVALKGKISTIANNGKAQNVAKRVEPAFAAAIAAYKTNPNSFVAKRDAVAKYIQAIALLMNDIGFIDPEFSASQAEKIFSWIKEIPEFKTLEKRQSAERTIDDSKNQAKMEAARKIEQAERVKKNKKIDIAKNLPLIFEILVKLDNSIVPFSSDAVIDSNDFDNEFINSLDFLKETSKRFITDEKSVNRCLTYLDLAKLLSTIKIDKPEQASIEKDIKPPTPKQEQKIEKVNEDDSSESVEAINIDLDENYGKVFRLYLNSVIKEKIAKENTKLFASKYLEGPDRNKHVNYENANGLRSEDNPKEKIKKYEELLDLLKSDFLKLHVSSIKSAKSLKDVYNIVMDNVKPDRVKVEEKPKPSLNLQRIEVPKEVKPKSGLYGNINLPSEFDENDSDDFNKEAQFSRPINWTRKKMHEFSFWEKTSPLRLKLSDLAEKGKKLSNELMDVLERDIEYAKIKAIIKEFVQVHKKMKEILSALIDVISNVKYEGNVSNLLSDRYDYESNFDDEDYYHLKKQLERNRRYKIMKDLEL